MNNTNYEFFEIYKRIDNFCRDALGGKRGVSDYIEEMERCGLYLDGAYDKLKHYRWVRNQLAHENGAMDEKICSAADVEWLNGFYNELLSVADPLSIRRERLERIKNTRSARVKQPETAHITQDNLLYKNNPEPLKEYPKVDNPIYRSDFRNYDDFRSSRVDKYTDEYEDEKDGNLVNKLIVFILVVILLMLIAFTCYVAMYY